jgi:N-acetylglucosaminyldiphosphoundecaprenol N-acetyl-beta-D-mannosaminyltransferase
LLVALGAPKQEKWIAKNLAKVPSVKVAIGVGSAFNLISGQIKRAPKIFQALGLEWLWRFFREPRRWRKIWRSVIIFPLLVIKEKL